MSAVNDGTCGVEPRFLPAFLRGPVSFAKRACHSAADSGEETVGVRGRATTEGSRYA